MSGNDEAPAATSVSRAVEISKRSGAANNEAQVEEEAISVSYSLTSMQLNILFSVMGMATLFPYNALIACEDYFQALYPEERDVAGQLAASCLLGLLGTTMVLLLIPLSSGKYKSDAHFPILSSVSDQGSESLCIAWRSGLYEVVTSSTHRILSGYALVFLLLLILPGCSLWGQNNSTYNGPSMGWLKVLSFGVGTADAIAQSGLYVFAATYHVPSYSGAVSSGSAAAGLIVSLLRIMTRGIYATDNTKGLEQGTNVLFVVCSFVMAMCMSALVCTVRDRRYQEGPLPDEDIDMDDDHNAAIDSSHERKHTLDSFLDEPTSYNNSYSKTSLVDSCPQPSEERNKRHLEGNVLDHENDLSPVFEIDTASDEGFDDNCASFPGNDFVFDGEDEYSKAWYVRWMKHSSAALYIETMRIIWKPLIATFLNFWVTLSLFPGTIASIESNPEEHNLISLGDWLPIVLITVFNLADCAGRILLSVDRFGISRILLVRLEDANHQAHSKEHRRVLLPNYDRMVWYPSLLRFMFYPIFALCVLPSVANSIISSDLMRCFIVFIFGLSNGFIACAAFMATPTMVHGERHRDASSLLLLFSIYTSLLGGAYFGLMVDKVFSLLERT